MTRLGFKLAVIAACLGLAAAALTAGTAAAAPAYCADRGVITARLTEQYSEQLVGGGIQSSNSLIEVWTTTTGNTWTILMTRPDGIACVMATGTDWYTSSPTPPGVPG